MFLRTTTFALLDRDDGERALADRIFERGLRWQMVLSAYRDDVPFGVRPSDLVEHVSQGRPLPRLGLLPGAAGR